MILPCITAKLAASMPPSAVVNFCENLKLQEKAFTARFYLHLRLEISRPFDS